jgi:SAM-dependent methyltransferase
MMHQCPLCLSHDFNIICKVETKLIIREYHSRFHFDIGTDFQNVEMVYLLICKSCDLSYFLPLCSASERLYEHLQQFEYYYLDNKYEFIFANQFIANTHDVLEIGCGKGAFSSIIRANSFVGLEYSKKACEFGNHNNITIKNEDISSHSYKHIEEYDIVCAFQVLEHVPDVHLFIKSCLMCLKPGGILIYSVPSADSFVGTIKDDILNMPPHHLTLWSDKCLTNIAGIFDLSMIALRHEKLAPYHTRWYATRLIYESLKNAFGYQNKLFDRSPAHNVLSKFASLGGHLLEKGLSDPRLLPRGHSVIAVYRKPVTGAVDR